MRLIRNFLKKIFSTNNKTIIASANYHQRELNKSFDNRMMVPGNHYLYDLMPFIIAREFKHERYH